MKKVFFVIHLVAVFFSIKTNKFSFNTVNDFRKGKTNFTQSDFIVQAYALYHATTQYSKRIGITHGIYFYGFLVTLNILIIGR